MSLSILFSGKMGVRGLTTYIADNADRYLDSMELHDCNLIIDGDSLCCQLNKLTNSAFGGNYDHFFRTMVNFFEMLKQCNITAYVLLDGGYQPKKLLTVRRRLRSKIGAIKHLNPYTCHETFPILMREVFVEAMEHCGINFMRCFFEADDEVAALSRKLKCPILSFDSDFYIHNVTYIPSNTLVLKVFRRNIPTDDSTKKVRQRKVLVSELDSHGDFRIFKTQKASKEPDASVKTYHFMQCEVYRIENLVREKSLPAEMLPLFAILLGNDFVNRSIFRKFYLNVSMKNTGKRNTQQGKRIIALLRWLQHETLDSAIDKIINHTEKDKKKWLREQIGIGISGYIHEESIAYHFFGLSNKSSYNSIEINIKSNETQRKESLNSEEEIPSDDDCESEDDCEKCDSEDEGLKSETDESEEEPQMESEKTNFDIRNIDVSEFTPPDWLSKKILAGRMPRYIVDLMTLRLYINAPQVENFQLPDCNRIAMPILRLIFTILHHPSHREFRYLTRVQRRIDIEYKRFESLPTDTEFNTERDDNFDVFKLVLSDFENAEQMLEAINENVPLNLRLYFIAIIYWSKFSKHFNVAYASSLVLCQIVLSVIDSKVGAIRNPQRFEKVFNPSGIKKPTASKGKDCQASIETCEAEITRDECILAQSNLIELFTLSEKLRAKHTEFSSDIIHGFAEFQAIVYQLNCLNILCGEPYPSIIMSKCFNGCFLYNTYMTLKDRPNIKYYIENFLLKNAPNLFNLFESILSVLTPFVKCLLKETISKRKKARNMIKKKKKEQRKITETLEESEVKQSDLVEQSGSDFEDLNNKFSCLMKN